MSNWKDTSKMGHEEMCCRDMMWLK